VGHFTATFDQDSFRGRNDDGSETAATWIAAANTNWTQDADTTFRLRFLVQETAGGALNNKGCQWQYRLNAGTWTNITTTSTVCKAVDSPNLVDATDTTQQLGAGTFIATNAGITEDGLNAGVADFAGNDETEFEAPLQIISGDVTDADTLEIRLVDEDGTTVLDAYTNTPSITVNILAAHTMDQASFRARNDDGSESAATWIAAINTNWVQQAQNNFRVRFLIQETAGGALPNMVVKLQFRVNAGAWTDVGPASNSVRTRLSPNFAEGDDTTQQLGAGTFITPNGGMDEDDGLTGEGGVLDFAGNDEVEVEYCIHFHGDDLLDNDNVELRCVHSDNATFAAYTNVPQITARIHRAVTHKIIYAGQVSVIDAFNLTRPLKGLQQYIGKVATLTKSVLNFPQKGLLQYKGNIPTTRAITLGRVSPAKGLLQYKGGLLTVRTVQVMQPAKGLLQIVGYPPSLGVAAGQGNPAKGLLQFKGAVPVVRPLTVSRVSPSKGLLQLKGYLPTAAGISKTAVSKGLIQFKGQLPVVRAISFAAPAKGLLQFKGYLPLATPTVISTVVPFKGLLQFKGGLSTTTDITVVLPVTGRLNYLGQISSVIRIARKIPTAGKLIFAGQQAVVRDIAVISPVTGKLLFKGLIPTTATPIRPVAGLLHLKGQLPFIGRGVRIAPAVGKLHLVGKLPSIRIVASITPVTGKLIFKGYRPQIYEGVSLQKGLLSFIGKQPTITKVMAVYPTTGKLIYLGNTPEIFRTLGINPSAHKITFYGRVPTVTGFRWDVVAPGTGAWSAVAAASETWSAVPIQSTNWTKL